MDAIYLDSDTTVIWDNFVNASTGTPITTATIAGIVETLSGTTLISFDMTYDSDLESYTGNIPPSDDLVLGVEYYIVLTATLDSTTSVKRKRVIAAFDDFCD